MNFTPSRKVINTEKLPIVREGSRLGDVTADHGERKHADHHQQAVFYIQIFVFTVGVGGHSARQYVGRQGNADRHVRVHVQEGDEHGADDGGSTHARKAGAESGTHACENVTITVKSRAISVYLLQDFV